MWTWIFGFTISLFLLFEAADYIDIIVLMPLILLSIFGLIELTFRMSKVGWVKSIDILILWIVSIVLIIFISMHRYTDLQIMDLFSIFIVSCLSIAFIYMSCFDHGKPYRMKLLNGFSFIMSILIFMCFYGVQTQHLPTYSPFIPFSISLVTEIYILYILYYGMDGLTEEFTIQWFKQRIVITISVALFLLVCIIHYIDIISDTWLYTFSLIGYLLGFMIDSLIVNNYIWKDNRICMRTNYIKLLKEEQHGISLDNEY